MSSPLPKGKMIAIQVLSILLFATVSAAAPEYAWLFFILYFVLFMAVMARTVSKSIKRPPAKSELGSSLFREVGVVQALTQDKQLYVELRSQLRFVTLNFVLLFLIIPLITVYNTYLAPVVSNLVSPENYGVFLNRFAVYLFMYIFFIAVTQGFRVILLRKPPMQPVYPMRLFEVYKKGILLDGRQFIPVEDIECFKPNTERKFVELRLKKSPMPVRLYTLELSRLSEVFRGVHLNECEET